MVKLATCHNSHNLLVLLLNLHKKDYQVAAGQVFQQLVTGSERLWCYCNNLVFIMFMGSGRLSALYKLLPQFPLINLLKAQIRFLLFYNIISYKYNQLANAVHVLPILLIVTQLIVNQKISFRGIYVVASYQISHFVKIVVDLLIIYHQ